MANQALKAGFEFHLIHEEKTFFVQFFYYHMTRSPDFHAPIVDEVSRGEFFQEAINDFESRYRLLSESEYSEINSYHVRQRIINQSRVLNIGRASIKILELLGQRRIVLATPARSKKQFIVASNPVVRFENSRGATLEGEDVELWTTLTPKIALGLVSDSSVSNHVLIGDTEVSQINLTLFKNSSSVASSNSKLLESIVSAC